MEVQINGHEWCRSIVYSMGIPMVIVWSWPEHDYWITHWIDYWSAQFMTIDLHFHSMTHWIDHFSTISLLMNTLLSSPLINGYTAHCTALMQRADQWAVQGRCAQPIDPPVDLHCACAVQIITYTYRYTAGPLYRIKGLFNRVNGLFNGQIKYPLNPLNRTIQMVGHDPLMKVSVHFLLNYLVMDWAIGNSMGCAMVYRRCAQPIDSIDPHIYSLHRWHNG